MKVSELQTIILIAASILTGCNQSSSNDNAANILGIVAIQQQLNERSKQCSTEVDNDKTFDIASPLELCKPSLGHGRHFRFERVGTSQNNGYLNLLIGYGLREDNNNFPTITGFGGTAATTTNGDGRWRVFMGKSQSCDQPWFDIRFSGINGGYAAGNGIKANLFTTNSLQTSNPPQLTSGCTAQPSGIWGPSTVCMDITKGSIGNSPRITIWATGINGADCNNIKTLTSETKLWEKKNWTSLVETRDDRNYIYRNLDGIQVERVVVRSETAIKD